MHPGCFWGNPWHVCAISMAEHCNSRLSRPVLLGGSMLEMPQMKPSKHSLVVVLKYMRSDWLTTIAFTAAMGCFGFSGTPTTPSPPRKVQSPLWETPAASAGRLRCRGDRLHGASDRKRSPQNVPRGTWNIGTMGKCGSIYRFSTWWLSIYIYIFISIFISCWGDYHYYPYSYHMLVIPREQVPQTPMVLVDSAGLFHRLQRCLWRWRGIPGPTGSADGQRGFSCFPADHVPWIIAWGPGTGVVQPSKVTILALGIHGVP